LSSRPWTKVVKTKKSEKKMNQFRFYGCCLLWIDEAKANIKPIEECRCNERL
jgi:hypothetical protein